MKYALIDGEIHHRQREDDTFWPLSLAEAQHVVDTMNDLVAARLLANGATWNIPAGMIERAEALLDSDDKPE